MHLAHPHTLELRAGGNLATQSGSTLAIPTADGNGLSFDLTGVAFPSSALGNVTYVVTGAASIIALQFDPTSPPGMVRVRASAAPVGGPTTYFAGMLVGE